MGMIVYVVTSGEYSDYGIEEIFTDREKAELYCATRKDSYYPPQIEEYETDTEQIEGKVYRAIKFQAKKDHYNEVWKFRKDVFESRMIYDIKPIEEDFKRKLYPSGYYYTFIIPVNEHKTYEQMEKIAQDRWNKYMAEQEGL